MLRIVVIAWLAATSAPALGQSMFHGDATRSGVYAGPGPTRAPSVQWAFAAAGPIVTSPVIVDGIVYIGSLSGHLYGIDTQTGREKWNFKSRMPIASSVAVGGGLAYFVSSAGSLVALDVTTGQPKWVFAFDAERKFEARNLHGYPPASQTIPDAWDVFTSSPALAGDKVYFGAGDGNVYAVDAHNGVLLWKYQTGDVVHASPAVANGTVFIGSFDGNLYALDAGSGQPKWVFKGGQDPSIHNQVGFQSSPAVVDGVVYVGCRDAHVYAIDAATGRRKWDYPTSKSWVNGTPAVRDGIVYAATSDSSRFIALDARTGRLRFNFDAKAYVFSSAALAGGLAYFGSHNGKVYAVDAATGVPAWTFQTEASQKNASSVLNADGSLRREAFTPLFGDFEDMYLDFQRFVSVGGILSSPAVDHGVLYVGSLDGKLYALK